MSDPVSRSPLWCLSVMLVYCWTYELVIDTSVMVSGASSHS